MLSFLLPNTIDMVGTQTRNTPPIEGQILLGAAASEGVGIGEAFIIPDAQEAGRESIKSAQSDTSTGADTDWARFIAARDTVHHRIQTQLDALPKNPISKLHAPSNAQREVLETYILMLLDDVFINELKIFYYESAQGTNDANITCIEDAIAAKAEEYAVRLREAGNDYLSERAQDITDIFGRVVDEMLGVKSFDMTTVPQGAVIVAKTLCATDMIAISAAHIAGIALETGGAQSHVAILARAYSIPCVAGLAGIMSAVSASEHEKRQTIIVDGTKGEVVICPDANTLAMAQERVKEGARRRRALKGFKTKAAQTKDGEKFLLFANIGTVDEAEKARDAGADGIGLFRTEFLYMNAFKSGMGGARSFDEDSQTEAYRKVLTVMKGKSVVIRTLDAGGDKLLRPNDALISGEKNPLMGMRAVRLSLKRPEMLRTQLRALYRASTAGDLRIMFPLITDITQVRDCKEIAAEVRAQLHDEGVEINDNVPLGIMVETAAAAITSDVLAKECDFFSLGTNDLTQYTLGVDRENNAVSNLYDETNLAVLRLIRYTVQSATAAGIDVCVCGEMAGRSDTAPLLAGLGVRRLSMASALIAPTKELLLHYTIEALKASADKQLNV